MSNLQLIEHVCTVLYHQDFLIQSAVYLLGGLKIGKGQNARPKLFGCSLTTCSTLAESNKIQNLNVAYKLRFHHHWLKNC